MTCAKVEEIEEKIRELERDLACLKNPDPNQKYVDKPYDLDSYCQRVKLSGKTKIYAVIGRNNDSNYLSSRDIEDMERKLDASFNSLNGNTYDDIPLKSYQYVIVFWRKFD